MQNAKNYNFHSRKRNKREKIGKTHFWSFQLARRRLVSFIHFCYSNCTHLRPCSRRWRSTEICPVWFLNEKRALKTKSCFQCISKSKAKVANLNEKSWTKMKITSPTKEPLESSRRKWQSLKCSQWSTREILSKMMSWNEKNYEFYTRNLTTTKSQVSGTLVFLVQGDDFWGSKAKMLRNLLEKWNIFGSRSTTRLQAANNNNY